MPAPKSIRIAVSVVALATISAGALWGWSWWTKERARAEQAETVRWSELRIARQREVRIARGVEKARRVIGVLPLPDMWTNGDDAWRVKQWTVAAELHRTPEQLRSELTAAYAEARALAPAPDDALKLQTRTAEEMAARQHTGQAGELAFGLAHFAEAKIHFETAAKMAAAEGDDAEILRWQEEDADVLAATGQNGPELELRRGIEEMRQRLRQPDPAPALVSAKTALAWWRGGKPEKGFSIIDDFVKAHPVHLDTAHPEALFVSGTHSMLLLVKGGEYRREAEAEMRQNLTECERVYGQDSPQATIAAVRLARHLGTEWKTTDAKIAFDRAKDLCEKNFGPEHPMTSLVLLSQAITLGKAGDAENSARLLERVLDADEKCFLPDSQQIANVLFFAGGMAIKRSKLAEARRYLRGSLDISQRVGGANSPMAVHARDSLAHVEELLGASPAVPSNGGQEALLKLESNSAKDPPAFVNSLLTEGRLQLRTGKYQEAEKIFRNALDVAKRNPQCSGVMTAVVLVNLGDCLVYSQKWMEAEASLKEALAIQEAVQGPNHPDLTVTLTHLANVLFSENRPTEANRLLDRALKLCRLRTGPLSEETLFTLSAVGRNLGRLKHYPEALSIQRLVLEDSRINYGRESMRYGGALYQLGRTEMQQGNLTEAEHAFEEAVAIGKKSAENERSMVAWETDLASCYVSHHKLAEAEPLFRQSVLTLLGLAKETGKDPVALAPTLQLYSRHLQSMGLTPERAAERIDRLRRGEKVPDLQGP